MKIPILAGTDAGNYGVFFGYSLHNELLEYCRAGMTPSDAICSATQNIRQFFPEIKIGKIALGYKADLVILNANPLEKIENTKKIDFIVHNGKLATKKNFNLMAANVIKPLNFDPGVFDIEKLEKFPSYISSYSDKSIGGSSEIKAQLQKESSGTNYINLKGNVDKKGFIGFAGINFRLGKAEEKPVLINAFKAIEFDVKGNGGTYYVKLISDLIKDFNYHTAPFQTTQEWKTTRIVFDDLKQNPWYGKKVDLDLQTITSIRFEAADEDYSIDFNLKNLHLIK